MISSQRLIYHVGDRCASVTSPLERFAEGLRFTVWPHDVHGHGSLDLCGDLRQDGAHTWGALNSTIAANTATKAERRPWAEIGKNVGETGPHCHPGFLADFPVGTLLGAKVRSVRAVSATKQPIHLEGWRSLLKVFGPLFYTLVWPFSLFAIFPFISGYSHFSRFAVLSVLHVVTFSWIFSGVRRVWKNLKM